MIIILNKLALGITNRFSNIVDLTSVEREKVAYVLEAMLSEITKIFLIYIMFFSFGRSMDFVMILLFSSLLRMHLGGSHLNSYISCLLASAIYFASMFVVNTYISIDSNYLFIVAILAGIIVGFLAPIIPKERRDIKSLAKNKLLLKVKSVLLCLTYMIIYVIFPGSYTRYGLWIIIIQSLLLMIAKGGYLNEEINE